MGWSRREEPVERGARLVRLFGGDIGGAESDEEVVLRRRERHRALQRRYRVGKLILFEQRQSEVVARDVVIGEQLRRDAVSDTASCQRLSSP